jgi:hypothetical protein
MITVKRGAENTAVGIRLRDLAACEPFIYAGDVTSSQPPVFIKLGNGPGSSVELLMLCPNVLVTHHAGDGCVLEVDLACEWHLPAPKA